MEENVAITGGIIKSTGFDAAAPASTGALTTSAATIIATIPADLFPLMRETDPASFAAPFADSLGEFDWSPVS